MSEEIRIEYRRLDEIAQLRWNRNPKKHDIGALAESIRRYGFIDPPKIDMALNGGAGGLVYGNGRDEALEWMHAQGEKPPRGIRIDNDGMWLMPVKVGVDAASSEEAEAAAIDHNNLTLAGGEFTAVDMSRLWTDEYTDILADLAKLDMLPISVDGDDLDVLLRITGDGTSDVSELWRGMSEFEQEDKTAYQSIHVHFKSKNDVESFSRLINQTLTDKTRAIWYPQAEKVDMVSEYWTDET